MGDRTDKLKRVRALTRASIRLDQAWDMLLAPEEEEERKILSTTSKILRGRARAVLSDALTLDAEPTAENMIWDAFYMASVAEMDPERGRD